GSFLVEVISAWKLLRKHNVELFKRAVRIAITIGAVSAFAMLFTGHWQAQYLVESQPMKMAAAEALREHSGDPAPFTVFAAVNEAEKKEDSEVQIPYVLTFLSFNEFSGFLDGIKDLQEQYGGKYAPGEYI